VSLLLFEHNGIRLSAFAARDGSHLDTMLTMIDQPAAIVGRPAWRVTVLGEADRLDAQMASALPASDSAASPSRRVDAIRQAIGYGAPFGGRQWHASTLLTSLEQLQHPTERAGYFGADSTDRDG
jgi:hypothetical protein